jgi:hypothetical protein
MCSTSSRSSESVEHDKLLIGRPPLLSSSLCLHSLTILRKLNCAETWEESGRKEIRRNLAHRLRLRSTVSVLTKDKEGQLFSSHFVGVPSEHIISLFNSSSCSGLARCWPGAGDEPSINHLTLLLCGHR